MILHPKSPLSHGRGMRNSVMKTHGFVAAAVKKRKISSSCLLCKSREIMSVLPFSHKSKSNNAICKFSCVLPVCDQGRQLIGWKLCKWVNVAWIRGNKSLCRNITCIPRAPIGRKAGHLMWKQEGALGTSKTHKEQKTKKRWKMVRLLDNFQ